MSGESVHGDGQKRKKEEIEHIYRTGLGSYGRKNRIWSFVPNRYDMMMKLVPPQAALRATTGDDPKTINQHPNADDADSNLRVILQ